MTDSTRDESLSVSRPPGEEESRFSAPAPAIEGYQILEKLGEAGQGQVWRAVQLSTQRQVALKVPRVGLLSSKKTLARFEREVEIAAQLRHPHIAQIFDSGVHQGLYYYTMDLVEGQHLDHHVREKGLSQHEILELMKVVCAAVQYAHQNGVIHRDLKPSNILVTKEGHPYLVDFGLAKSIEDPHAAATVSVDGEAAGTPAYMSPEQAAGHLEQIDTRTDVYSLGAILFTLLTGQHPHDLSGSHLDVLRRITEGEVIQPRRLSPKMDRDLEALLLKALEHDPDRRYSSAAGLAEDIERYLHGRPLNAAPRSRIHGVYSFVRRHRVGVLIGLLITLLSSGAVCTLAVSAVLVWWEQQRTQAALDREHQAVQEARSAQLREVTAREDAQRQQQEAVRQRDGSHRNLYVAQMRLGQQYWEAGQLIALNDMLESYIPGPSGPDVRGWEWYYLLSLCHRDVLTLRGQGNSHHAVAWSPDGQKLATAGDDSALRVWDLNVPQTPRALRSPNNWLSCVAWSPNGRWLACSHLGGQIRIWDAAAGQEMLTFLQEGGAAAVAWSPDSDSLASMEGQNTTGGTFTLWNPWSRSKRWVSARHVGPLSDLAWSPDGIHIASADGGGWVRIWDIRTGQETLSWRAQVKDLLTIAWSPDGRQLATGGFDHPVRIWDTKKAHEVLALPQATEVERIAWSPDGNRLALATRKQIVVVADARTGQELLTLRGHVGWVKSVAWSPNGAFLASGSNDNTVKVWDTRTDPRALALRHSGAAGLVWPGPGRQLATIGGGEIRIWEPNTARVVDSWRIDSNDMESIAWSPDGRYLACGNRDGKDGPLDVWDVKTREKIVMPMPSLPAGSRPDWCPKGERLAICTGNRVEVRKISTNELVWNLRGHRGNLRVACWNPPGDRIAAAGEDGTILIWDAASGTLLHTIRGHVNGQWIGALAWDPQGRSLASGGWDQMVKVWDALDAREILSLRGHTGAIGSVAWHPDGRRLASTGFDGTIKLWDTVSGQELLTLQGHGRSVKALAWSPEGKSLASAGQDGTIRIWNAERGYKVVDSAAYRYDRARYYRNLGQDLEASDRHVDACRAWERSEAYNPTDANVCYARHKALCQLEEYGKALSALYKCVEVEPNMAVAHWGIAGLLTEGPDPNLWNAAEALPHASRAIQIMPRRRDCYVTLALAQCRTGQGQNAVETLRGDLPKFSDLTSSRARFVLAMAYRQLGDQQKAQYWYDEAVRWWEDMDGGNEVAIMRLRCEAAELFGERPDAEGSYPPVEQGRITRVKATTNCRSDSDTGLLRLVDGGGLSSRDGDGQLAHDNDKDSMWLGECPRAGGWLEFELDRVHRLRLIKIWNYNAQGRTPCGIKRADISVWTDKVGWQKVFDDIRFSEAPGSSGYAAPRLIALGGLKTHRVRLHDLVAWGGSEHIGLSEIQFFDICGPQARPLFPADGADVGGTELVGLRWVPGLNAVRHDVYLGTAPDRLTLVGKGFAHSVFSLGGLGNGRSYFWRVDETGPDGKTVAGKPRRFTTGSLVGWWRLDETAGRIATDSSDFTNHGELAGDARWQPGRLNGALGFDGNGDFVRIRNMPPLNIIHKITVAAWIKVNAFDKDRQTIISKGEDSWQFQRAVSTDGIEFACTGVRLENPSQGCVVGRMSVNDGQWHHVAGSYDGTELRLYIDGKLDGSAKGLGPINAGASDVLIGENPEKTGRSWNGSIDDVRVYSYALSQEQVRGICTGVRGESVDAQDTPRKNDRSIPSSPPETERPLQSPDTPKTPLEGANLPEQRRRLVSSGTKASWSPDGSRLVFGRPKDGGLQILTLDQGRTTDLTASGKDPAWSPDGRFIAYVDKANSDTSQPEEVWLIASTGGASRRLTEGGYPVWSADGKILFVHSRNQNRICAVAVDKLDAEPEVFFSRPQSWYPAISPDGKRIAFGVRNALVIVDRATGETILTWPTPGRRGLLPAWSPDGRQVAFGGFDNEPFGVWVLDVEAKEAMLVAEGQHTMPAWSNDGTKLAFDLRSGQTREIWMFQIKATQAPRLRAAEVKAEESSGPRGGEGDNAASKP